MSNNDTSNNNNNLAAPTQMSAMCQVLYIHHPNPHHRLHMRCGELYFLKMATMISPIPHTLLEFCPLTIKSWSLISFSLNLGGLVTHL